MKTRIVLLSLAAVVLMLGPAQAKEPQGSAWRGKIEKREGLTIVSNPKDPLYRPDTLKLEKELSIGEVEGAKDYVFVHPWYVAADDNGNMYVMDQGDTCVKVYDAHGKYLRSIGRKGQGPGELQNPNAIYLISGGRLVFEDFMRGLNTYTAEGRFVNFLPTAGLWFIDVLVTPESRIVALANAVASARTGKELRVYDEQLKLLKTLRLFPDEPYEAGVARPFARRFHLVLAQGDRIVMSSKDDYEIEIVDIGGSSSTIIRRDYDPVDITKTEIEEVTKRMRGRKLEIPAHHPAVQEISTDDEGRIYVQTFEKTKDGRAFYYDVFDAEGRYLLKTPILQAVRPLVWKKQRLYCLEEDAEGFQRVTRYRVLWQIPN